MVASASSSENADVALTRGRQDHAFVQATAAGSGSAAPSAPEQASVDKWLLGARPDSPEAAREEGEKGKVETLDSDTLSQTMSEKESLNEWLCEMCRDIPMPSKPSIGPFGKLSQLFKLVRSSLGLCMDRIAIPHGVTSLYDLVARVIVKEEVDRVAAYFPDSATILNPDSGLCFPLSLLRGRCTLVVNTATQ